MGQEKYNEEKIRKRFGGRRFETAKQYLTEVILDGLRYHHRNESLGIKLKNLIINVEILFKKSLYRHCAEVLNKAEQIALRVEQHLVLLEILNWKLRLFTLPSLVNFFKEKEESILRRREKLIREYEKVMRYQRFSIQALDLEDKINSSRSPQSIESYKKLIQDPLMTNEAMADSFAAKYFLYTRKTGYYLTMEESENGEIYAKKTLELLESRDDFLKEFSLHYFRTLYNLCSVQIERRNFMKAAKTLDKLRNTVIKEPRRNDRHVSSEIEIFTLVTMLESRLMLESFRLDLVPGLIRRIQEGMGKYGNKIHHGFGQNFLFFQAKYYFYAGQYPEGMKLLNRMQENPMRQHDPGLYRTSLILEILFHFEIGNTDLLESRLKSLYRFLYKTGNPYRFEKLLMDLLKKNMKYAGLAPDWIKIFKELKNQLEPVLAENIFERRAISELDLISWLESKISGKSFTDLIKERFEKK